MTIVTLTQYFGKTANREAHVLLYDDKYIKVRMRNSAGSWFVASFDTEEEAEIFAEDYALGEIDG
jgi:hypothetical protein